MVLYKRYGNARKTGFIPYHVFVGEETRWGIGQLPPIEESARFAAFPDQPASRHRLINRRGCVVESRLCAGDNLGGVVEVFETESAARNRFRVLREQYAGDTRWSVIEQPQGTPQ